MEVKFCETFSPTNTLMRLKAGSMQSAIDMLSIGIQIIQIGEIRVKANRSAKVFLTGSFVDWNWKIPMRKSDSNDEWSAMIELLPGHHEYKFIVDSKWRIDALNLPTKISNNGHVTHVLHL
ncbi:5'-AMP-activated protein kinase subunit beta-2 [Toxocara canis]|uniref:5'-AMP-activated protein kinase subunit beta-1 n=1 Tax=Toxocara canis TaxID=6265 RepID=A0A0B2V8E8_TOXCA|nr:5'-AMP-activated protein kinase subunit beta-2 [Toxocara canis]